MATTAPHVTERRRAPRVRIGELWIDAVRFDEALEEIRELVLGREGGAVFTPNVDHVVMAERDAAFRAAHRHADLVLADGMPLLWYSRLARTPLPEKVSGSDLIWPLARLAADEGWRVYLLGGAAGTGWGAAQRMSAAVGMRVAGVDESFVRLDDDGPEMRAVIDRIRVASPDLLLVAFGAPKQELWIDRWRDALAPAVAIGVGGSFDFVTGRVRRSPRWMSRVGLEWLYRLAHEPRRLWRRYLVQDPSFVRIAARTLRLAPDARASRP